MHTAAGARSGARRHPQPGRRKATRRRCYAYGSPRLGPRAARKRRGLPPSVLAAAGKYRGCSRAPTSRNTNDCACSYSARAASSSPVSVGVLASVFRMAATAGASRTASRASFRASACRPIASNRASTKRSPGWLASAGCGCREPRNRHRLPQAVGHATPSASPGPRRASTKRGLTAGPARSRLVRASASPVLSRALPRLLCAWARPGTRCTASAPVIRASSKRRAACRTRHLDW